MNLLLLAPSQSSYDVLTDFSKQLHEGLLSSGHQSYLYIPIEQSIRLTLDEISLICNRFDISNFVCFNAAYFEIMDLFIDKKVNLFGWMVDYPIYHFKRLTSSPQHRKFIFSANANHSCYINELTGSNYMGTLDLGVNSINLNLNNTLFENREFDVVFIGSWMGEPKKFWESIIHPKIRSIAKNIVESLIADETKDPYLLLKKEFIKNKFEINSNLELINSLLMEIINFCRFSSRIKILNAVIQSGLKTLVIGKGWDKKFANPHVYFHEPVSNSQMPYIYQNCKIAICLNSNDGGCERALQAIASGCAVFSFEGQSINRLAENIDSICTVKSSLSIKAVSSMLQKWHEKITSPGYLFDSSDNFIKNHNWKTSALTLVQQISNT